MEYLIYDQVYEITILNVSKLPGEVFSGETPTVEVDGDRQRSQLVNHLGGGVPSDCSLICCI